ncbi:SLAC1 anion channel family protein [Thiomicrorhabdus sp. zzn3]|uniref:SLAC1 anion channel family protein n=1 Tax=Thiomicrorhabdus sp. zzn3 TaxID=3039775 RepID=UPI002436C988|nr:SLAC1 anion channel family protein [Thiomicrorhabdus sp. zzn3]MDG6778015.1 SLAC1 anion channel family protein [Thiomicrorhabdus sp. zzn3]
MSHSESRLAKLQYFPIGFFGMIMGMLGFCIALLKVESLFGWPVQIGGGLLMAVIVMFLVLLASYLYKMVRFKSAFWEDMRHPLKMNFMATIAISLLLLSIAFWELEQVKTSFNLWLLGTSLQFIFTLWVLYHWIHHDFFKIEHSNPAWFIPIVGNIIVPIAGVHHAPADISWFFFAIGIVFWPMIKTVLLYRIIFHPPLPDKLVPTLFIFIAPPAVGFISYVALNYGEIDAFAKILYFFALFFTVFLVFSINRFRGTSFALSWWAYTFPLAAISIASLLMAKLTDSMGYAWLGMTILTLLGILITWLFFKTMKAVMAQKVCTPEH